MRRMPRTIRPTCSLRGLSGPYGASLGPGAGVLVESRMPACRPPGSSLHPSNRSLGGVSARNVRRSSELSPSGSHRSSRSLSRLLRVESWTEAEADALPLQLRDEFVGQSMIEMKPWRKDEALRGPGVEFLARTSSPRRGRGSSLG